MARAKLKRWTTELRERAEKMWQDGASEADTARELNLPVALVRQEFKELSDGVPPKKASSKKKAASKKASVKKASAKKSKTDAASPGRTGSKKARIAHAINMVNTAMKADVLHLATDYSTDYLLRRPTGIMSLDIGLGGGWPASALSVICGPDSVGKNYLLNLTMAQQQRIYGKDFAGMIYSSEFKFDKVFARKAGFLVALTDEELRRLDISRAKKGHPPLTEEERVEYQTQIGEVVLLDGLVFDDALDAVLDMVAVNEFQVIAIDSLGVMPTAAKEEKESLREHAIQSNEAQLLSRFMPALFTTLNRNDQNGRRNQTCVLALDQVRANRDLPRARPGFRVSEKQKIKRASGSKALAHGKAIELMLYKGKDYVDKEQKPPLKLGREVEWDVLKGKIGTHDGLHGQFDFWFDEGADLMTDLIDTASSLGVIKKSGAWYSYQDEGRGIDFSVQGARAALLELEEHPEVIEDIRQACLRESDINCLYE